MICSLWLFLATLPLLLLHALSSLKPDTITAIGQMRFIER
jgi:hypothetical protein